ncbi:hypothetical protein JCM5353_000277 [Sporobolomyces roseus]
MDEDLATPDASFDHSDVERDDSYFSQHSASLPLQEGSVDPTEPDPTLSAVSSPAHSSASVVDSLAGANWQDVEQIVLESISNAPPTRQQELRELGGGVDAFDGLPRKLTGMGREELIEAEKRAMDYLKKMVEDSDQDDWMYPTPQVFGPSKSLGLRSDQEKGPERGREGEEGVGWDDKDGNGPAWMDRAFNLERYQVEGLSGSLNELGIATINAREEPLVEDWQGSGGGFGDTIEEEGGFSFNG